jgi:nucleoside-diphosphate-sugar epimerase
VIGPLTRLPLTHVENCADLFALAMQDPRASGETLNVVDGPGPRNWTFIRDCLDRMGERRIRIPIPYSLAYRAVSAAFALVFQRNLKLPGLLIPRRFQARLRPLRYTNRRAQEVLGWRPPLDFRECLARTFAVEPTPEPALELAAGASR